MFQGDSGRENQESRVCLWVERGSPAAGAGAGWSGGCVSSRRDRVPEKLPEDGGVCRASVRGPGAELRRLEGP